MSPNHLARRAARTYPRRDRSEGGPDMRKRIALVVAMLGAVVVPVQHARANFHFIKIAEVFVGVEDESEYSGAQYIRLVTYEAGQTDLGGHDIDVYRADGTLKTSIPLSDVSNASSDDDSITIGTEAVEEIFPDNGSE